MKKELENHYTEKFNKPDLACELKYGKRIKELRKANKMTHKELAGKIGIAPRTLQMWESGKNLSFISKMSKLADLFGVSITDEKEKRYLVKIVGMDNINGYLSYNKKLKKWFFGIASESRPYRSKHTRKELEDAGFGEVFNCPLFEIEEVEE